MCDIFNHIGLVFLQIEMKCNSSNWVTVKCHRRVFELIFSKIEYVYITCDQIITRAEMTGDEKDVFWWRWVPMSNVWCNGDASGNFRRWITQMMRDILTSTIQRLCLHEHVENMRLRHFEPWCISPNVRRLLCSPRGCSAIYRRWFLATKHWDKIPMHAFTFLSMSRCLGEVWRLLAYVADHSPNYSRAVSLPWRCPNLNIAKISVGLKGLVWP